MAKCKMQNANGKTGVVFTLIFLTILRKYYAETNFFPD